ncbi:MAG: FKBP-type peptidyl-prolyl cis-trans isomerase [Prevotellaceae bacterium]|jgi:FKBP-type peptidyl-prolyl cis-trans isomerase FklB|nr:FKBP-type peptidyl-prolyl cis-trans isomerase [Prevotellaceae bacterium]
MKHLFYISVLSLLLLSCESNGSKTSVNLSNGSDSLSYAVGIDLAEQLFANPQQSFDLSIVGQAIKDFKEGKAKMNSQEAYMFMQMYQQRELQRQMQEASNPETLKQYEEKNKAAGEKFLEENKTKDGVVTLSNGIQYKIIKQGNGPKPKATDVVEVFYKGTLIDGTVFDSNEGAEHPINFPLNGVIKGWTEGLQHINEGSKVTLYIPQELAYGSTPRPGGPIEPYMALIFDIELVKVTPLD